MILNVGHGEDTYGDVRTDMYPSRFTTVVHDIESGLPFKDDTFDEVYSHCVLEHTRNLGKLIDEMARVCRPRGRIVIITDNAGYWRFFSGFDIGNTHCGNYRGSRGPKDKHYAVFTTDHLRNLMEAANLSIRECDYLSWDDSRVARRPRIYPITGWIDAVFGSIPALRHMAFPRIRVMAVKPPSSNNSTSADRGLQKIP